MTTKTVRSGFAFSGTVFLHFEFLSYLESQSYVVLHFAINKIIIGYESHYIKYKKIFPMLCSLARRFKKNKTPKKNILYCTSSGT